MKKKHESWTESFCCCKKYTSKVLPQLYKMATLACNNRVCAFGGRTNSGPVQRRITFFNKEKYTFDSVFLDQLPLLESSAAASTTKGYFVFGGAAVIEQNQLWKWTPDFFKILSESVEQVDDVNGPGPSSRCDHTVVSYNDSLVIFGGFIDLLGSSNETWILPMQSGKLRWRRGTAARKARHSHSAEIFLDEMYVFGGTNQHEVVADFEKYNFAMDRWIRVPSASRNDPCPRYAHSSCATGDFMFIYGGIDAFNNMLDDLWLFSFKAKIWSSVSFDSISRPGPCAFARLHVWDPEDEQGSRSRSATDDRVEQTFLNSFINEAFDPDLPPYPRNCFAMPPTKSMEHAQSITNPCGNSSLNDSALRDSVVRNPDSGAAHKPLLIPLLLFGGKFACHDDNLHLSTWKIMVNISK